MSGPDDELVERAQERLGTVLLGKYRLDRVLGIGGMATVYAATHRNGNEFAVKMLHADLSLRADVRNRFLREGHAAGSVKHPGAVQVLDDDVGEDGSAFLVMELLRGESLEVLWDRHDRRLALPLVAGIGIQLLDVLEAAHVRGVVHRDIKPGNIFLTRTGQVKVLDFGIARIRDIAAAQATQTGMTMGTPAFMAPEQAMGKTSEVGAQTDVWAVGATLYTLACGTFVHEDENAQLVMIRAATTPAPRLIDVLPDAAPGFAEVIDRSLAFEKANRWPSAGAMREALRSAAQTAWRGYPGPEALAEVVHEPRDSVSAAQTLELPARDTGVESDIPTTRHLPSAPTPEPALHPGVPVAELATAQPVFSDAPRRPAKSPMILALAAFGVAALAGTAIALGLFLGRPSSRAAATPPTAPASSSVPALPEPIASTSASAIPATTLEPVPIDRLPTARTPGRSAPAPAPAAPPAASTAPAKPDCNPPYTFDSDGNRKWKRECLQ